MKRVLVFLLLMALIFVFGACTQGTQYDKNGNLIKKATAYILFPDGYMKIVDVKSYMLYANSCTIIDDFDGHRYLVSPVNVVIDEEVVK